MPYRCVVGGCSNEPDHEKGFALHKIPFTNDHRQEEAGKQRQSLVRGQANQGADDQLSDLGPVVQSANNSCSAETLHISKLR